MLRAERVTAQAAPKRAGPSRRPGRAQRPDASPRARTVAGRVVPLIVAAVVLYGVAPAILEVGGAYRRLNDVDPG